MKQLHPPKNSKAPAHFWLQLTDEDGEIVGNRRAFQTWGCAKRIAAHLCQSEAHTVLILHGSADPENPQPGAILADFSREQLSRNHRRVL